MSLFAPFWLTIVVAVAVPAGFFVTLFLSAALYRQRLDILPTARTTRTKPLLPRCFCCRARHAEIEPFTMLMTRAARPSPTTPASAQSPGLARRKASFAQPEIDESVVTVRRISADPAQGDTLQRVNSVGSVLLSGANPSSDVLPLGGRKSSIGSTLTLGEMGYIGSMICVGERRPSAEGLQPRDGCYSVRRVSAGGIEDVVSIRAPIQSLASLTGGLVDPQDDGEEVIQNAALAGPSGTSHSPIQLPVMPEVPIMELPPLSARKHRRPDSIDITLAAKPSLRSAPVTATPRQFPTSPKTSKSSRAAKMPRTPRSAGIMDTAASNTAVKSPWTGSTVETSTGVIFQAWKGFPSATTGDGEEEQDHEDTKASVKIMEGLHTPVTTSRPNTDRPLQYQDESAESRLSPLVLEKAIIAVYWSGTGDVEEKMDQLVPANRPSTPTKKPHQPLIPQDAPSPPILPSLQITSPIEKPKTDSSLAPVASATLSASPPPRNQRVTYLADLVKEHETRMPSDLSSTTSNDKTSGKTERPRSALSFPNLHLPRRGKRPRSMSSSTIPSDKDDDHEDTERHGRLAHLFNSMTHRTPHDQEIPPSHLVPMMVGTCVTGLKPPQALHRSRSALEVKRTEVASALAKHTSLDLSRSIADVET